MGHAVYKNGYKDGSGKGTITLNKHAVLRTHWGCNCCDNGPTEEDILEADLIVKKLNNHDEILAALKYMVCAYETPFELQSDYRNEYLKAKQAIQNCEK